MEKKVTDFTCKQLRVWNVPSKPLALVKESRGEHYQTFFATAMCYHAKRKLPSLEDSSENWIPSLAVEKLFEESGEAQGHMTFMILLAVMVKKCYIESISSL